MILLTHNIEKVVEIIDLDSKKQIENISGFPLEALFQLAKKNKDRILVWCNESYKEHINLEGIRTSFHLKNMMLSFSKNQYLPEQIGYVEDSPFLKVNKTVKYPTWLMSSEVGAIHTSQLLKFEGKVNLMESFDYVLNSIAKLGMPNGLFCYSTPNLLKQKKLRFNQPKVTTFQLFKFVKQHYKWVWAFLLMLNFAINERKFPFFSFLRSIFIKRLNVQLKFNLEPILNTSSDSKTSIDVIVPTLGRSEHVHNFLKDLVNQTKLPNQVIIIEQNADKNSSTDLGFIKEDTWPFKIIHKFIHQTGACNARNIGLGLVTSDCVFLADDDIRIDSGFITSALKKMKLLQLSAVTLSCLGKNDVKTLNTTFQWSAFGSGCSIVETKRLKDLKFDMKYEFGYGEDIDFGMQLRNTGTDIIYLPNPEILHLKAPMGGFRTKFAHPWESDIVKPKPSPTVMLNRKENTTEFQLLGYKTVLFLQFYKQQNIKNPIKYLKIFKKQWQSSKVWANHLNRTV